MRNYGSRYLSDHRGPKIGVICKRCGMRKRYNRLAMVAKVGDECMPTLLERIAKAEGCERANLPDRARYNDPCGLVYDRETVEDNR